MAGYIDFRNNGAQQGFQNALGMGLQMGAQAAEAANRRGFRNALTEYDPSQPDSWKEVAKYDPKLGVQLRKEEQAMQAQQAEAGLVQQAMAGDTSALDKLATVNFDKWKTLDTRQKEATVNETKVFGNAALDLLNTPPEQRGAKLQGYVQQLAPQYPEVAQIAQLPPEQLEAALRSAVFEAQMVDKLISMEQPRYMAIPEGGTLVDTRNPQAVQQFGQQSGQIPRITSEEDYNSIPPGQQYYDPQGNLRTKGGASGNASGGF